MRYIKNFELFGVNETMDMMSMPSDPIAGTLDVYADVFAGAKEALAEIKDGLVGGLERFKEIVSRIADFIFEKIGAKGIANAVSKFLGIDAKFEDLGFADSRVGRQTTNWKEPNKLVEYLKSIDFKSLKKRFLEYEGMPQLSDPSSSKKSYDGFVQGFISLIQTVIYGANFANILTMGVGGKLLADLYGCTMSIWSSLGLVFLATLVAMVVFALVRKSIYAISGGKIA